MDDLKKHMSVFFDPKRVFAASFGPMNGNDVKKMINKTIFTDKLVKFEKFPYEEIDVEKYIPKSNKVVLINKPGSKDNHQDENAKILSNNNLALNLNQIDNDFNKARKYIKDLINDNKKIIEIKENFKKIEIKNANELIYKLVTDE